jgi:hypothetical protein
LDEDIARVARALEALEPGHEMLSEQADELKRVLAHAKKTAGPLRVKPLALRIAAPPNTALDR